MSLKIGLLAAMIAATDGCALRTHSVGPSITRRVQRREVYILTSDQRGSVVVIYGDSDGVTGLLRNGLSSDTSMTLERVYRIPKSGFLRIRDEYPPEGSTASIRPVSGLAAVRVWGECSAFEAKLRTAPYALTGCWLPQIAPSNVHPIPFYVAAVVADSLQLQAIYARTFQLIADSVFRGRVDIPPAWRKPPP
jgi:hypothetical protein